MPDPVTIQETLVELLEAGPKEKSVLIQGGVEESHATIQGVYKALRMLRDKEVVTIHGSVVSLSFFWIDKGLARFGQIAEAYQTPTRSQYFLQLKPGEKISLKFRTLRELDLYWDHAFLLLETQLPTSLPAYSVVPHDWFYYARPQTDKLWVKRHEMHGRKQRVVITHPTPIDRELLNARRAKLLEAMFGANPFHQDERCHFNIIGDWVFEAKLDGGVNDKLVAWIRKHKKFTEKERSEIDDILDSRGKFTLKIGHAPKRARQMTDRLEKYFQ